MEVKNILKIVSVFINLEKEFKDVIEDENVAVSEEIKTEFDVLLKALKVYKVYPYDITP